MEIGSLIALIIFQYLELVRSVDVMIKNQQQFLHQSSLPLESRQQSLKPVSAASSDSRDSRYSASGSPGLGTCLEIDLSKSLF